MQGETQISFKGLSVWLVCALFFMYEFLLRTVLGTFQLPLMDELDLTPVRFAVLSSTSYQVIYGLMQIPVGIITGRFGLKKTLLLAVVICMVANVGFAMTHHFATATFFRVLMGLGSSFGFVCLLIAVYDWLPRKNAAFFIGVSQFIGTLGPMLAAGPLNMAAQAQLITWRGLFFSLAFAAAVITLLVFFIVEKNRQNTGKFIILQRPTSIKDNIIRLAMQPQIWFIGLFSSSIYFSIEYLSENEGVIFLQAKGFSSNYAAYMVTVAWLGYALGCPLVGFLSDLMQKRKPMMIICSMLTVLSLLGIIYLPPYPMMTAFIFILLGIGASGQSLGFAIMAEQCKQDYLAIGLGFNNAMIMVFAAISAPLIGFILATKEALHPLSLGDLQSTLLIMVPLSMVAFFSSTMLLSETFCKMTKINTPLTT